MNGHRAIALLGRRDEPTDAVEEYCRYLGEALRAHDFELELVRVAWLEDGWPRADLLFEPAHKFTVRKLI